MKLPWRSADPDPLEVALHAIVDIQEHLKAVPPPLDLNDVVADSISKNAERGARHEVELKEIRHEVATLRIALAEGIEHEERRERRIKSVVQRARKQLQALDLEDGALEAEYGDLSEDDGEGSDGDGVLPLHEDVAAPAEDTPSSIRGVSLEQLQRARGLTG